MSTEQPEHTERKRPHVLTFFRDGGLIAKKPGELLLLLREIEVSVITTGDGAKDSPMAINSSSVFADTAHDWKKVDDKCHKSMAKLPLYLIRFTGFDDGDWIIVTDMSWSMNVHSRVDGQDANFSVCSVPTSASVCTLSSDQPPTSTATICALDNADFQSEAKFPKRYNARHSFRHQPGKNGKHGNLKDVVLKVGNSFSAKFHRDVHARDCTVEFGVPERLCKGFADLFENKAE